MKKAIFVLKILISSSLVLAQGQLENQYFAAWQDIPSLAQPSIYQEPVGIPGPHQTKHQ